MKITAHSATTKQWQIIVAALRTGSQSEAARQVGVTRQYVNKVVNDMMGDLRPGFRPRSRP